MKIDRRNLQAFTGDIKLVLRNKNRYQPKTMEKEKSRLRRNLSQKYYICGSTLGHFHFP